MCTSINTHTHTHQRKWHRMTRMTGPDCAVMCNLINTHTHTQCEWHSMTRMTGSDCAVMCNLINTHTYTHTYIASYRENHEMAGGTPGGRRYLVEPQGIAGPASR